jgi:hypothetical protein
MLTYKNILGLTPPYLRYLLHPSSSTYNTRSASHILLKVAPLFSLLQLATGTSCKKHSNWIVLSPSLHSKTQSWTLLLTLVAASRDVLLCLPSFSLCCCLCPIMFVPCFVLLPRCIAAMLCCYCVIVMLCCYHAVLSCDADMLCCCL